MQTLLQDIRYGIRRFKSDPAFMAVMVLTLALGIGVTSAIFSIVDGVLLRPLPYKDSNRVVLLMEQTRQFPRFTVSYQNYIDWRDQSHSFSSVGAVRNTIMTLSGTGEPERLPAQMTTANLFSTLGVNIPVGRAFNQQEDSAGGAGVALISQGLWQRRFGGSQGVLGQSLTLDDKSYTIIGVLPAGYQVLLSLPDVVLPFEPWARTLPDDRAWHPGIVPIARLKPGVTLEQARTEMTGIAQRLEKEYPIYNTGTGAFVNPIQDQMVENVRPALLVLMGAVGFVLLIACTNVANLLLARSTGRQREIAVRSAIGASRARIVRQLLTENVLLAVLSAALGLVMAWAAIPTLLRLAGSTLPFGNRVSIDVRVLIFTIAVAMLSGILFGLAPVRHIWRMDVRESLNETDRGGVTRGISTLRAILVIAEVAVAVLLLVGAGLLIRSFDRLANVSPGFSADHILVADIPLSPNSRRTPVERLDFWDRVLQQAAALPGVRSASGTSFLPASGAGFALYFNIKDRPPKKNEYSITNYHVVSTDYFSTLQIPLIQGRLFQPSDRETQPTVVVINSAMAHTFFPNESPLGHYLQMGGLPSDEIPWMEVVGVVGDVKQALASEAPTELYIPYRQSDRIRPVLSMSLAIRTAGDPNALANSLRTLVHNIDPNQPVAKIRSMESTIADSISQPRFRTLLLTIFAAIALVLAAIGIFSVMAYSVAQRTREIGVRVAIGASRSQVFQLILGYALKLTVMGLVVGMLGALALTRYVATFLFHVSSYDPVTLTGMAAVILAVSTLACYIPARRATRIDPVTALRQD